MPADSNIAVKLAIYQHFGKSGKRPDIADIISATGADATNVQTALHALVKDRVLVLEADALTIRMAPPFSGVQTQHRVESDGISYFGNCAWDALGIAAALKRPAMVHSECAQSGRPLQLKVPESGPEPCEWLFHSRVPAARWWQDIVFT